MTRPRPIRDAALALALLTLVPTGVEWPEEGGTDMAGWFPAVGLLVGGVWWGAVALAVRTGYAAARPLLMAAVLLAAIALLTRFLHWDGLADVADAWWGGATTEERLEIMSDTATGAFGTTAVVLASTLQVIAIADLAYDGTVWPFAVVPVFARLAATFAAWLGRPAREGGLGRSVMGRPNAAAIVPAVLVVTGAVGLAFAWGGVWGMLLSGVGVLLALAVPHLVSQRMGGVTGDVMGASVLVVETALFVGAAAIVGVW